MLLLLLAASASCVATFLFLWPLVNIQVVGVFFKTLCNKQKKGKHKTRVQKTPQQPAMNNVYILLPDFITETKFCQMLLR